MVIGKQGMDFLEAEKENSIKKPKNVTILTHEHVRDKNGEEILEKQKAIVNKLDNMRRFIQYDISETDNPDETLKYLNDLQEVVSKLTYPSKMMKKGKIPYKQAKSKKQTEEQLGQAQADLQKDNGSSILRSDRHVLENSLSILRLHKGPPI